jgi:hypothetical protein
VSRIIAHRAANGLGACSANTTSYCNARGRIVTGVLRTLARRTAQELQAAAAEDWKWNARDVFIADGSHVSMPDTPENQASYPQPPGPSHDSSSLADSCCRSCSGVSLRNSQKLRSGNFSPSRP